MNAVGTTSNFPLTSRRPGRAASSHPKMQDHVDRPQGTFQSFSAQVAIMKNQFNLYVTG